MSSRIPYTSAAVPTKENHKTVNNQDIRENRLLHLEQAIQHNILLINILHNTWVVLTQQHCHFVLTRSARNYVAVERLAVKEDLSDSLADSVRVLDGDFIEGSAETAGNGVFLPLRADAWIDLQTVVCRLDTEDELGDRIPVPCGGSCEPAVLGFARLGSILAGDHL